MKRYNISSGQIINMILVTILLVFVAQNLDNVRVRFLFFGFDLPFVILIAIVFFVGFFTAKAFKKSEDDNQKERGSEKE